jgi:hypothetical protein
VIKNKQDSGKETSGFVCTQCATLEEFIRARPFTRIKPGNKARAVLKYIAIVVIFMLAIGFIIDLFSGFYILRRSQSVYAGLAGLLIMAMLFVMGEAGSEWIGSKEDITYPLYKRAFHLFLLLLFAGLALVMMWFALKNLGLIKV